MSQAQTAKPVAEKEIPRELQILSAAVADLCAGGDQLSIMLQPALREPDPPSPVAAESAPAPPPNPSTQIGVTLRGLTEQLRSATRIAMDAHDRLEL